MGLAGCGGGSGSGGTTEKAAQQVPQVAEEAAVLPRLEGQTVPPAAAQQQQSSQPAPSLRPRATRAPQTVSLQAPSKKELQSLQRGAAAGNGGGDTGRKQTGIGRALQATSLESALAGLLAWELLADGSQVASIKLSSPGALEIRLGVKVGALPPQAVLRVFGPGSGDAQEVAGRQVLEAIERNRAAGDLSDAARTYWLPPVSGAEAVLEIELPASVRTSDVRLSIPLLSHGLVDVSEVKKKIQAAGDSLSCNIDVSCNGTAYDVESAATVQLKFVENGDTYNCTGTVLAASDNSFTPYLLTAHHCFSNQTVASTLVSTFFFRSASCNSAVSRATAKLSDGATWLYSSSGTDSTFVRLNSSLPSGAHLAGWTATTQSTGAGLLGLHHPASDMQKSSIGSVIGYLNCSVADTDGFFSCTPVTQDNSTFYSVDWTQGITEGGSSGSGVWTTSGANRYIVGNLRGGTARCSANGSGGYQYLGTSIYGRFDIAYNAALKRWLSPAGSTTARNPVYRFYNASTGAHFYTQSAAERDFVVANNPGFKYEGVAFYAYSAPLSTGTAPVHRFYSPISGSHFYTISDAEKNIVVTNPRYTYEGTSWNAQLQAGGTAVPIYRFFNPSRGTHFFTINEGEKNIVLTNPGYVYEGVAYYGWTTQ